MRRAAWFAVFFVVAALVSAGAFAETPCPGPACTTLAGKVVDPNGNPIPNYSVFAKLGQKYQQTGVSDAAGRFSLQVPTDPSGNCWIVGGSPDEHYTGAGVPGTVCGTHTNLVLNPLYRVRSQAPVKETYVPNLGTVPYHLELYANSRTYPAPFHNDPLTWTLTYHSLGNSERNVRAQGVFSAPTATKTGAASWRYVWKVDFAPVVTEPTMIHVDWGAASKFGQMMDCRMIFVGIGQNPQSKAVAPGQPVTLTGTGFGATTGKIVLEQNTSVTWVDPNLILSWSDKSITFLVPPTVTSNAYVRAFRADGMAPWCLGLDKNLPTNKVPLAIKLA